MHDSDDIAIFIPDRTSKSPIKNVDRLAIFINNRPRGAFLCIQEHIVTSRNTPVRKPENMSVFFGNRPIDIISRIKNQVIDQVNLVDYLENYSLMFKISFCGNRKDTKAVNLYECHYRFPVLVARARQKVDTVATIIIPAPAIQIIGEFGELIPEPRNTPPNASRKASRDETREFWVE